MHTPVDDGRAPRVQEVQSLEDLPAPGLDDLGVEGLEPSDVLFEGAGGHELGDDDDRTLGPLVASRRRLGLFGDLPEVVEPDDVGVLEVLQHLGLFAEPVSLRLGDILRKKLTPRH